MENSAATNIPSPNLVEDAKIYYEYKYTKKETLRGHNYKDIFSEDYIYDCESRIFDTELSKKYLRNNFDYLSYYKENLKSIYPFILSDFDNNPIKNNFFVKTENAFNLKIAVNSIKKCTGIYSNDFDNIISKFQLEDVTKELFELMTQAKKEGINKAKERLTREPALVFDIKLFQKFIDDVKTNGKYDIKEKAPYDKNLQFIFDEKVIDYDDTGNMLYGVYGKAIFSTLLNNTMDMIKIGKDDTEKTIENILYFGGGVYNAFTTIKNGAKEAINKRDLTRLLDAINTEVSWLKYLGDDPRDREAIKMGFEYYDKIKI